MTRSLKDHSSSHPPSYPNPSSNSYKFWRQWCPYLRRRFWPTYLPSHQSKIYASNSWLYSCELHQFHWSVWCSKWGVHKFDAFLVFQLCLTYFFCLHNLLFRLGDLQLFWSFWSTSECKILSCFSRPCRPASSLQSYGSFFSKLLTIIYTLPYLSIIIRTLLSPNCVAFSNGRLNNMIWQLAASENYGIHYNFLRLRLPGRLFSLPLSYRLSAPKRICNNASFQTFLLARSSLAPSSARIL